MAFITQLSEDEFAELLRPKLRLFLSVDVVGSTAYKHSSKLSANQEWLSFFVSFFTEFDGGFEKARIALRKRKRREPVAEPQLWKSLGDELVYVVELKHSSDAAFYVSAFRAAVNELIEFHSKGEGRLPISFKAAAWLVGFPLGNAAIPVRNENGDISYDFIGPLVDTGFRIASYASSRRLAVSADLALLLIRGGSDDLKFYYDGRESLDGVIENRGYPIIWIDMHAPSVEAYEKSEDDLVGRKPAEESKLRLFCEQFIDQVGEPLMQPFIATDSETSPVPYTYQRRVDDLEVSLRKIFIVGEDTDPSEGSGDTDEQLKAKIHQIKIRPSESDPDS